MRTEIKTETRSERLSSSVSVFNDSAEQLVILIKCAFYIRIYPQSTSG